MNFIIDQKIKEREDFFADINLKDHINFKRVSIIAVMHMIDTGIPYANTLDKYFTLEHIIPKPKSINKDLIRFYPKDKILNLTRNDLQGIKFLKYLEKIPEKNKIIFLDIGGYFSPVINGIKNKFGDRVIGVIEDTENGHQKYLKNNNISVPVVSVARSPLKANEDYLVGQAVLFSTEAILREQGILINNKKVGIIGFGKIGNGILSSLIYKGSDISVYDTDHINLILAFSKGNKICKKIKLLRESDIVFCATGNLALRGNEFKYLKNAAFVVSVTSSDDELDISWLEENYTKEKVSKYIDKYDKNGHYLFLLNNGNAVNFIHGSVVDDFILLVQKEIIDTIITMNNNRLTNGVQDSFKDVRDRVADLWLKYFFKKKL